MEAYKLTGIYKFRSSASYIYKKLNLIWEPSSSLYLLDNEDKYKYTSRDVGAVISGLNAMRLFGEDEYRDDAEYKLVQFFNSAVNSSNLVQSCIQPPVSSDFEGVFNCLRSGSEEIVYNNFCHPDIPQYLETGTAPVFAKKFTFKPKKHKFDINSKSFYSEYALYSANEMLQLGYPEIECFYDRETPVHEEIDVSEEAEKNDNVEMGDNVSTENVQ
jgi:hypothetical protein